MKNICKMMAVSVLAISTAAFGACKNGNEKQASGNGDAQAASVENTTADQAASADKGNGPLKFKDFEVNGVKFSDYIGRGKYVLVDFWASWCRPCRGEIPNIKAVYQKYAGEKFDVLSVAVWDDPEQTRAAAKDEGVTWNQIIDAQQIPTNLYGIEAIPQIMLFGPDGTLLKKDLRGPAIEKAVKEALGL